jgi:hypothetical protein
LFCIFVAVVTVCIVAVGFSLVTMDKTEVEEVTKALLEVASGNVRFTNSLYKVCGGCLADANVANLLCVLETEYDVYCAG